MTSKKTKLKVTKRNNKAGFLFLLPLIVIFIGLLGYSFYFLILNSFRDVTITFRRSEFVGLANYQTIFKDKSFWISLLNTFILSTANIFCGLTFGFIISIILNFKIKGKRFFHALFFIPSMLPIALMATVFGSMLEYKNGIVNQILRGVGLGALAQRWLADPKLAMGAVCSVSIFMIGIPIMYYTADLTTTDERLKRVQNGKQDLGLSCLFFHYNRYLMIACSRKGTQPANLQGIWSESIRPVWSSNWTININTEMNYWLNGPCNLIESFTAFVDFVEELSHAGEETAKKQCHCSGWTANHNVDIWRQTGPVDGEPKYAYWPMGGVWLCSQSYEYYRYSRDLEYLKNKIYPSLRGSVLFCLDWLQQREDGLYYTAPSTSPENTFKDGEGHACGVSYMTTMDLAIIKELFANYLEACNVLGIKEDLIEQVNERSKLLPNYQIGRTGKIQEWIKDFEEFDVGHRHFSPVFGFHPGHSIKKTDTELVKACQKFIEEKVANYKQQIGWSCAWLINLWARLGDGTKANYYYEELLRQSVYNNLFDLHPPLGETEGEREVFQIDGNFGSASAVAEMLLSSEDGKITILPALPESWESGKVKGLLAVGGVEVDIAWKNKKPISISLCSSVDQSINIFYGNKKLTEKIELKKQEQQIIDLHSCEWI